MGEAVRSNATRLVIERAMKDLPALPTVVTRIMEVTNNETASAAELERLISSDQAISAKVLRVVNSAYFGLSGQVSSIGQAIVILGFNHIRNLVLTLAATSMFHTQGDEASRLRIGLWKHAFATASCAQLIARKKRLDPRDHELVFVGGLLSNLGCLFLLSEIPNGFKQAFKTRERQGGSLAAAERGVVGMSHAEIGQELGIKWRLPEDLALLIGRHEGPFAGEPIPPLYVVHAADRYASLVCTGDHLLDAELDPLVDTWLSWTEEDDLWVRRETAIRLEAVSEMLAMIEG